MQELKVNKDFETREEMEKFIEVMSRKYIIFMINMKPVNIGDKDSYGIESIYHFGERN